MGSSELGRGLEAFLREDHFAKDVTSLASIPIRMGASARLVAQGMGILSGVAVARALARSVGLTVRLHARDGDRVSPGTLVLTLTGPARKVLAVERTLVNLVMHLSGVATATHSVVVRARRANPRFRVAATRKTLPGLRDLEKSAVTHGGGEPHRRDLSDAVLVKGNHQRLVGFEPSLGSALRYARAHRIPLMVEVHDRNEALQAARAGVPRLLLDNLSPSQVAGIHQHLIRAGVRAKVELEATGSIGIDNVEAYARSGADLASVGCITHSAKALPFHLVLARRGPAR